jgi:hypothetical protein
MVLRKGAWALPKFLPGAGVAKNDVSKKKDADTLYFFKITKSEPHLLSVRQIKGEKNEKLVRMCWVLAGNHCISLPPYSQIMRSLSPSGLCK